MDYRLRCYNGLWATDTDRRWLPWLFNGVVAVWWRCGGGGAVQCGTALMLAMHHTGGASEVLD
jgi:hypothetical protein